MSAVRVPIVVLANGTGIVPIGTYTSPEQDPIGSDNGLNYTSFIYLSYTAIGVGLVTVSIAESPVTGGEPTTGLPIIGQFANIAGTVTNQRINVLQLDRFWQYVITTTVALTGVTWTVSFGKLT